MSNLPAIPWRPEFYDAPQWREFRAQARASRMNYYRYVDPFTGALLGSVASWKRGIWASGPVFAWDRRPTGKRPSYIQ